MCKNQGKRRKIVGEYSKNFVSWISKIFETQNDFVTFRKKQNCKYWLFINRGYKSFAAMYWPINNYNSVELIYPCISRT